ncbi:FXYD domain containing ion transport regulator 7 isoform X1 [Clupea harengus]|uniref:FXYD domain-containing ion transport regulator n=1 Tax=Clupea harengus TaxID=7950 RepID=A0A6P8G9H2_CLUHA|nr:FXYD domain containing ion transport regulator 7 isoform X1 [Clupea harengus]
MSTTSESQFADQSAFEYDYYTLQTTGVILGFVMFVAGILIALTLWKQPRYPRQKCLLRLCERSCARQHWRELLQELIMGNLNYTECMATSISTMCGPLFQVHFSKRMHPFVYSTVTWSI